MTQGGVFDRLPTQTACFVSLAASPISCSCCSADNAGRVKQTKAFRGRGPLQLFSVRFHLPTKKDSMERYEYCFAFEHNARSFRIRKQTGAGWQFIHRAFRTN